MPSLKFEPGQLVQCHYDLHDFFYYVFGEDYGPPPTYYGIVVSVEREEHFYGAALYEIYCTDGQFRYFLEEEITCIPWLTFP